MPYIAVLDQPPVVACFEYLSGPVERLLVVLVPAFLLQFVPSTWLVAVEAEVVNASHAEKVGVG